MQSTFFVILRHEFKLEINILFYHAHTNGSTWRSSDRTFAGSKKILSRWLSNGDRCFVRVRMFTNNRLRFYIIWSAVLGRGGRSRSASRGAVAGVEVFRRREFTIEWLEKLIIKSASRQPSLVAQLPSNQIHDFFSHFFTTEWKTFFHLACISFLHNIFSFSKFQRPIETKLGTHTDAITAFQCYADDDVDL